jgi:hypothetical protein
MSSSLLFWIRQLARWAALPPPLPAPVSRPVAPGLLRVAAHDHPAPTVYLCMGDAPAALRRLIAPLFAGYGLHTLITTDIAAPLPADSLRAAPWFDGRLAVWAWGDLPAAADDLLPTDLVSVWFHAARQRPLPAQVLHDQSAVHFLTGWSAPAASATITEYLRQLALRRKPYLTVARQDQPLALLRTALAEGLPWCAAHFGLLPPPTRRAVRCAVKNSSEQHEMDFWPPPASLRRIALLPSALRGVWLSAPLEQPVDVIGRPTLSQLSSVLSERLTAPLELAVLMSGQPTQIITQGEPLPLSEVADRFNPDRLDLHPAAHRLPAGARLRLTVRNAQHSSDRALELTLPLIDAPALARMSSYVPTVQRKRPESRP